MSVIRCASFGEREYRTRYDLPFIEGMYNYDKSAIEEIKKLRKTYVHQQDEYRLEQKKFGRENLEYAKWTKEEIKRYTQMEKSTTIFLKWIDSDVGDNSVNNWPLEYSENLDYIANKYLLLLG